jgi:hypothetical protein
MAAELLVAAVYHFARLVPAAGLLVKLGQAHQQPERWVLPAWLQLRHGHFLLQLCSQLVKLLPLELAAAWQHRSRSRLQLVAQQEKGKLRFAKEVLLTSHTWPQLQPLSSAHRCLTRW